VGVDSKTKIIHTAVATAANVADSAVLPDLLHGEETRVWGDQAYRGQSEVIRECAPQALNTQRLKRHGLIQSFLKRMEYVDLLDPLGRPMGRTKPKSAVHRDGDWHGAAHVWILNTEGLILIQRRSPTKENWPNLWDVSVAGHVSAGEEPVEAAIREAKEELGVTLVPGECRYLFTVAEQVALNNGNYFDNEYHHVFLVEKDLGTL